MITDAEFASFKADGFLLKKGLFTPKEASLLSQVTRAESQINGSRSDGRATELFAVAVDGPPAPAGAAARDRRRRSIYNAVCYSERTVRCVSRLLQARDPHHEGIYLHHRKIIMKDQDSAGGGADQNGQVDAVRQGATEPKKNSFLWHQDYGYWGPRSYWDPELEPQAVGALDAYGAAGMPAPNPVTMAVAIDPARCSNGCLQMLRGSHTLGQLEFVREPWNEIYVAPAAVQRALDSGHEPVHMEQEPGDALFFDCETVHSSGANETADPRWAFLCTFDTLTNTADPRFGNAYGAFLGGCKSCALAGAHERMQHPSR